MVWLLLVVAWLVFGFFCYCLLRTGRAEDALRERLARRADVEARRQSSATVEDSGTEASGVPRDSEDGLTSYTTFI